MDVLLAALHYWNLCFTVEDNDLLSVVFFCAMLLFGLVVEAIADDICGTHW